MIFIATWHYIREQRNRYLWWFTGGLVLMFATMEAAFIYVAIFGSFLIVRLLALIVRADWLGEVLPRLWTGALVALLGIVLVGVGYGAHRYLPQPEETATVTATSEGFAVDPDATLATTQTEESPASQAMRWVEMVGIALFSLGLFLIVRQMRPHIDRYPEFDLIVLYVSLLLPLISPMFIRIVGWNPVDYSVNVCQVSGQETLSALQVAVVRLTSSECLAGYAQSGTADRASSWSLRWWLAYLSASGGTGSGGLSPRSSSMSSSPCSIHRSSPTLLDGAPVWWARWATG